MIEGLAELLPPGSIGLLTPRETKDAKIRRHLLLLLQMVQGGYKLARGQIAAGAENDDGTGIDGFSFLPQAERGGFFERRVLVHDPNDG